VGVPAKIQARALVTHAELHVSILTTGSRTRAVGWLRVQRGGVRERRVQAAAAAGAETEREARAHLRAAVRVGGERVTHAWASRLQAQLDALQPTR
jgi:hypothetical protein